MKNYKLLSFLLVLFIMSCEPQELESNQIIVSDTGDQKDVKVNEKEDDD
ncbi:MAG: hypothetical protein ABJ092_12815 [Gillisia sp.]